VGSVTISLSIQPVSADGTTTSTAVDDDEKCHEKTGDSLLDKVVIAVEDTGIGIEDVTDLFTDFKQATKSTTREYGGTGLGLSIVKNLTSLMRGKVNLESTLGKGTKIWCELCLSRCLEVPRSVPPFPSVMTTKKARPLNNENNEEVQLRKDCFRILVAEDIQTNQRILLNMMKRLGYNKNNIEFAENGQIAVDKYLQSLNSKDKNMKFDLILMDCLMPVLGGIEATTKIREIEGEDVSSCHIPILALTASAQKSVRDECMAAGMDAFITKPIILKTLDEELSNWLNTVGSEGSASTK
jgi:CheY-like chemotaxis protein